MDLYVRTMSNNVTKQLKDHFVKLALEDEFPLDLSDSKLYDDIVDIVYDEIRSHNPIKGDMRDIIEREDWK